MGYQTVNRWQSRSTCTKSAFSGVICSLCLCIMFLTALFPYFFNYIAPGFCGLLLLIPFFEFNRSTAITAYFSVAILSFFITPTKEAALLFLLFLGYYPLIHAALFVRGVAPFFRFTLGFFLFNASTALAYFCIYFLFGWENLSDLADKLLWVVLVLGNFTFFVYAFCLDQLVQSYHIRVHKQLSHLLFRPL